MAAIQANWFLRLHKWAVRQDENFTTEAFAIVLQVLLEREPAAGVQLVKMLTGGFLDVPAEQAKIIDLRTQVETTEGRPDLAIRTSDGLVWVEVKVESDLRAGQLEGYRRALQQSGVPRTRLVLLTRYPIWFAEDAEKPDLLIHWYQVGEWMEQGSGPGMLQDPISCFLCKEYLGFLEARNMTAAQVNWHMADGVRALRSLMYMLEEVAAFCKVSARRSIAWDTLGLQLDRKYWVGVHLDDPDQLRFHTEGCRIDPQAASGLGVGTVLEKDFAPGGLVWQRVVDLASEQAHFYSRSRARQMQWLEAFLRESLEFAHRIEVPGEAR